jgi:hypothetical protein
MFFLDFANNSICSIDIRVVVDGDTASLLCEFEADELAETPDIYISFFGLNLRIVEELKTNQ